MTQFPNCRKVLEEYLPPIYLLPFSFFFLTLSMNNVLKVFGTEKAYDVMSNIYNRELTETFLEGE